MLNPSLQKIARGARLLRSPSAASLGLHSKACGQGPEKGFGQESASQKVVQFNILWSSRILLQFGMLRGIFVCHISNWKRKADRAT